MAIPTLVLRTIKGTALTYQEMDSNFQNLANLEVAGSGTNYSNTNVAAYLTSQSITSYSNVQVGAYLTTNPPAGTYSNVQVANYLPIYSGNIANVRLGVSGVLTFPDGTTQTTAASGGGSSYGNANVTAYTVSMGFTNFSNVNVAALITTNGLTNYSNVNVVAYLAGNITVGNISATYFTGNGSQLTGLPSGSGIASVSADTTPSLGGNLNVNNKTIVAGNAEIGITQRLGWGDAFLHFGNSAPVQAGFKAGDNSSSPKGITAYLGSNVFASNFNIVSNIANGPGVNSPMGTGPLIVQNINSNNQAVTEVTILDNTGGSSGFFKPANANYDFSALLPAVKFGDAGFYNIGANITLLPLDFSDGLIAKGKVQIVGTGQSTPPFIFDIASGDMNMSLGNINLAAGKGVYVNGVALSGGGSYSNVQVATYLPTYSGNIANVRLGVAGVLTFADGTTQATASAGGGIANVSVDTTPTLGGNLNVNGKTILPGNAAVGIKMALGHGDSSFEFSNIAGPSGGIRYFTGNANVALGHKFQIVSNTATYADGVRGPLTVQNINTTSAEATAEVTLLDAGGSAAGFMKPSNSNYDGTATIGNPNFKYGDGGLYNVTSTGGNVALIPVDLSSGFQTKGWVTMYGAAQSVIPFAFNVASGDMVMTLGNINLAAGKQVTIGGTSLGYLEMPQVAAGNVTLALTDSGKHFYSTSAAPFTVTIPVNSSVAFPIGTEVTVVNRGTANLTVDKGSASLYLAGNTTSASRTITTYGVATLLKVETDIWMISGTGVV